VEKLQDAEYMFCDAVLHFKGFKAHTNPPDNERQSQPTAAAGGDSQLMEIERQNQHLKQVSAARFVVFLCSNCKEVFCF